MFIQLLRIKKKKLIDLLPHYSNKRFKKEQTIFGCPDESLSYDYSDRIWGWDRVKAQESFKVAKNSGKPLQSCSFLEVFLSTYLGYEIEIQHIVSGVNFSNGYPYYVLGYKKKL